MKGAYVDRDGEVAYDPSHTLGWHCKIVGIPRAYAHWNRQGEEVWPTAGVIRADEIEGTEEEARLFGHYLATMALGLGVGWFDDHERFPLVVPIFHHEIDEEDVAA